MPNDRRRALRLPFIVQVDLTWSAGEISAYSTDVSATGLFVRTDTQVPLQTQVKLEFVVFSQEAKLPVIVSGEVARLVTLEQSSVTGEVAGLGVRFRQLEKGEKELFQFLGQRLEAFQEPLPALPGAEIPLPDPNSESLKAHWGTKPELDNLATLYDIERRGSFFLETPAPIEVGTHVYLWFSLPLTPKPMPVKATATVTHLGTDGEKKRGMVVRFELSTLDIHIIEAFFRIRNRPAPEEPGQAPKKDDEFSRSLGLTPAKKVSAGQALADAAAEEVETSEARLPRSVLLAGGGAVLMFLLFLWLAFF